MVWPVGLTPSHAHPVSGRPVWEIAGSALLLTAVSGVAVAQRRKRPWLIVGWLWYLGMLVPVIGLVQVGVQARADRYTYLPQIGLYVMAAWTAAAACARRPALARTAAATAAAALLILACWAWRQTGYWHDSLTLWNHAVQCTPDNDFAHHNLGVSLADQGRLDDAIDHYRRAIALNPIYASAYRNLGICLYNQGKLAEAMQCCGQAVELDTRFADAESSLGVMLWKSGNKDEGLRHLRRALEIDPGHPLANANLGAIWPTRETSTRRSSITAGAIGKTRPRRRAAQSRRLASPPGKGRRSDRLLPDSPGKPSPRRGHAGSTGGGPGPLRSIRRSGRGRGPGDRVSAARTGAAGPRGPPAIGVLSEPAEVGPGCRPGPPTYSQRSAWGEQIMSADA